MIPRRRNKEEGDDSEGSGSNHQPIIAHLPSNGAAANGTHGEPSHSHPARKASSSSCCGRNKKMLVLVCLFSVLVLWLSQREKQLLDSSQYNDAREQYHKKNSHHERYSTVDRYKRNSKAPSGKFVLTEEDEFVPRIAWLMSFPNSGTSFTMTMVARSTNKSFATNYGREVIADDETDSYSIYPRRPEGPYWPGLSGKAYSARDLPDTYVITKTHCGSRCSKCGPDEYIETTEEYLKRCRSGHGMFTPGNKRRKYESEYPHNRVHKAIHLIRNPMHNVIARYHLEHRHKGEGYKNDTRWQESHANDATGLHKWCEGTATAYKPEDLEFFGKGKIPKAPCHGEFYKWTQWHNLAHQSIQWMRDGVDYGGERRDVPVLKVYYEDYKSDFESTANSILDFLEQKQVAPFREFASRSDYGDYFPDHELVEIKKLVKSVATNATWSDVKHYFEGIPDEHPGTPTKKQPGAATTGKKTANKKKKKKKSGGR